MFKALVFVNALLVIGSVSAFAVHPSHSSITEIEWNADSERFEVPMKLSIADLEDAISVKLNRRFSLETDKDASSHAQAYLKERFAITRSEDHVCLLHWVGMELELHDAWFYFEAESRPSETPRAVEKISGEQVVNSFDELLTSGVATNSTGSPSKSEKINSVRIKNAALTDVQPEQTNIVSLTVGRLSSSTVFTLKRFDDVLNLAPTGISTGKPK